ncbi:MAG: UbiA family prenyltransferase [Bacteroidia bacterium]|nr:UbiA family prenyltransferase [Bacteroidia bacterium]
MPLFILALSQAKNINYAHTIATFIIIHLLVYPASNGYNSYVDKDETPIGGLENPPQVTRQLFYVTLAMDALALLLSYLLVSTCFALCILAYMLASRAYSAKQIRLKKYAFVGMLTVVVFQGGFTFYMCTVGISNASFEFSFANIILLCGCSFQIAGAYPLTQIYQHEADLKDGVTTLSYSLGYMGTFVFTACMFGLCNLFYYLYFDNIHSLNQFYIVQLFFTPIVVFFIRWCFEVFEATTNANFKNTMRMNLIGAVCMNLCFVTLYLLNK